MSHTPTPWVVDYGCTRGHIKSVPEGTVKGVTGTPTVARYDIGIRPEDEEQANAAHIVKCVNHHDELIELLERAAISLYLAGNRHLNQIIKKALEKVDSE